MPTASDEAITARFQGTTSILVQDRETAILSDGFVTRPNAALVAGGPSAQPRAHQGNLDSRGDLSAGRDAPGIGCLRVRVLDEVVRRTGALRVALVDWDNFFRGLDRPLKAMRSPRDSFPDTWRRIKCLADADKADAVIPETWKPTDPFAGLA